MAITAMSAARSPYSMRSWPSHRVANSATSSNMRFMSPPLRSAYVGPRLCRRGEFRLNRVEDRVDVRAGQRQRCDRHERDQTHEQRVLDQVLPVVLARKRAYVPCPVHGFLLLGCGTGVRPPPP